MLMNRETSSLLVVDVQERLLPSIADGEAVLANCTGWWAWPGGWGAGGGVRAVSGRARADRRLAAGGCRRCAAGHQDPLFLRRRRLPVGTAVEQRRQVVVGTEAHVCVMQTVLELRWQGKEVFVVADAVGSRKPADKEAALARMRSHGVEIVTREMVAFEWLHDSAARCSARSTGTSSATIICYRSVSPRSGQLLDR
jgi:hypothetical protein